MKLNWASKSIQNQLTWFASVDSHSFDSSVFYYSS